VYATCLFCHAPLGRNETFETFPVGRRLAFDAARGRLWVVCRRCERWNLTPLEERWETIEAAERLYADARRRAASDEIGLARVREGVELVRIGRPLRPEFAAWRYGDQFGRRRRRQLALAGAGVGALAALVGGGIAAGVGVVSFGGLAGQAVQRLVRGSPNAVVARLDHLPNHPVVVTRRMLADTRILDDGGALGLEVQSGRGRWEFRGDAARRALAQLIPAVNRYGGSARDVQHAVGELDAAGGSEAYLDRLRRRAAGTRAAQRHTESSWWGKDEVPQTGLYALRPHDRLAAEMAVHEEQERRAMEGELAELEQAWRRAEEIAAIADDLLLPSGVLDRLRRLGGVE
jgi:hypothetical protein